MHIATAERRSLGELQEYRELLQSINMGRHAILLQSIKLIHKLSKKTKGQPSAAAAASAVAAAALGWPLCFFFLNFL